MRLILLIITILYFAIPVFAQVPGNTQQPQAGVIYNPTNREELRQIENEREQRQNEKEKLEQYKAVTKRCTRPTSYCSPWISECANLFNDCGNGKQIILDALDENKLSSMADDDADDPDAKISSKDLPKVRKKLQENKKAAIKSIEETIKKSGKKALGPCKDFTTAELVGYFTKRHEEAKKNVPEHKKEADRLEEKIEDIRKNSLEKEVDLLEKIQKNDARAKQLAGDLQAALNEAPLVLQAKVDELKAQFEIQNTVIEDIKNAVEDLDKELQDKTDEIEQMCVDEAETLVKEKRDEWKKRRTVGKNRLSVNSALRSASVMGSAGEDNLSFRDYYSQCLEKRKIKDLKAKAVRENIAKKKKLQNDLNRALIQAAKIQADIKREVDKSNIATKNMAQKINNEIALLNRQNQQLADQQNKLSALNGAQLLSLQTRLDEEKFSQAVEKNEEETLSSAAQALKITLGDDSSAKKTIEEYSKISDAISDFASYSEVTDAQSVLLDPLKKALGGNDCTVEQRKSATGSAR